MIWVDGTIVGDHELKISVLDRTFEHGLGLFETLRTWNGHATLLNRHLDRLRTSAHALGLPIDGVARPSQSDVDELLNADGREGDAMIRITLSGGLSEQSGAVLWMRTSPLPLMTSPEGFVLGTSLPVQARPLAAYKTLNYWPNRLLYEQARRDGFDEALMVSPSGEVLEGSRTNVFIGVKGRLHTPPADGRILPGIMRGMVIETALQLGIEVQQRTMDFREAKVEAEEIFLTNSGRGIIPVSRWEGTQYPAPGPITDRLWRTLKPRLDSGELS